MAWLFATALVVGVWAACGGGGGGGGGVTPGAPVVSLSPTSLTFSSQKVGTSSPAQNVTLTNTGTSILSITSIGLTGTNSGDFAQTNTCASSVISGGNCSINATFTPTAAGSRSASISITDNASGSPQTVNLSGTGVAGPTVSLSPTSLFFQANVDTISSPKIVALSNNGPGALNIASIAIGPSYTNFFAQTNNCGSSVASGTNCSINVTFTPQAYGGVSTSLEITDNASGSPQTVNLTGDGAMPVTPPGVYQITVNGVSGSDFHSVSTSVTVQ